nr:hypothetical protein [Tanacetum cinerariifolium]
MKESEAYNTYYAFATGKEIQNQNDEDETSVSKDEDDDDDQDNDDDNGQTDLDNDGDDFVHLNFSTHDQDERQDKEDRFDPWVQTPSHVETNDNEDNDEEIQNTDLDNDGDDFVHLNFSTHDQDERQDKEDRFDPWTNVQTTQVIEDTHVIKTPINPEGQQQSSSVSSGIVSNMLNPSPDTIVSSIPGIVDSYLTNKMNEAIKTVVQLQSDRLREEAQAKNKDFINKLDDNIKKIIKDQVKEQVKAQVSKILPKIKKNVNEQLEAEVLTCSSNESKTSYDVAANLSELELKKILIDKMKSNKVTIKRHRDDEDKDKEPSTGLNRGSKRRRAVKEPESTSAPKEKTSKTTGKSTEGSKSHHKSAGGTEDQPNEETAQLPDWFQKPAKPPFPDRDWNKTLPDAHAPVQPWLSSLAQMEDPPNKKSAHDVYSKHRIIVVIKLQIVKWHNYKHLDWIIVRRDDDKMYTFKEGDFNRLRIHDIKDMLLLLVQCKLTNLAIEERLAFNVSM